MMRFAHALIMVLWVMASTLAITADVHASVDAMPCHEMDDNAGHAAHDTAMPSPMERGDMHHEQNDNKAHTHDAPCEGDCCDGTCLCTMICSAYSGYTLTHLSIFSADKFAELHMFTNLSGKPYIDNLTDPPPRFLS